MGARPGLAFPFPSLFVYNLSRRHPILRGSPSCFTPCKMKSQLPPRLQPVSAWGGDYLAKFTTDTTAAYSKRKQGEGELRYPASHTPACSITPASALASSYAPRGQTKPF